MSIDGVVATLYAPNGTAAPAGSAVPVVLTRARGIRWQEELSKAGSASFEVPLADATLIVDRSVIKFTWRGSVRFACVIVSESSSLAVDGTRWVRYESQPGLLALLGDGVVRPEYGLGRKSQGQRRFGYMSLTDNWLVSSEWVAPSGVAWSADTGRRAGFPLVFQDSNPAWISFAGPNVSVAAGTVNYFRREFTLAAPMNVSILATGDNFLTLWVDGEQVISPDLSQPYAWLDAKEAKLALSTGGHTIAAKVENAPDTYGANPLAFIATVITLNNSGQPNGVLLKTATDWICHGPTPEPGWFRAQVLRRVFDEESGSTVAALGYTLTPPALGPSRLTRSFTDTLDSSGVAWTGRGEYVLDIATSPLDSVATRLSESGMDVRVNPSTLALDAYGRLGSDRSATVALLLGQDATGSLKNYTTTRAAARKTDVLTQMSDGTWVETVDSAALTSIGRIAVGLSLGSTSTPATATTVAQRALDDSSAPQVTVIAEGSTLTGAVPYVDYGLGDTITIPGHRAVGTIKARVLAITVDASGDTIRAWPELVHDQS